MMQCGGDAEFCRKLLDVFFFNFVLATLPELLRDEEEWTHGIVSVERGG